MLSLSHFYQTSHKFLFVAQETVQYDFLEMTSEWTQMSVTGRGSLPLNWGCISRGGGDTTVYGSQFLGRDTIQPPTHEKATTLT